MCRIEIERVSYMYHSYLPPINEVKVGTKNKFFGGTYMLRMFVIALFQEVFFCWLRDVEKRRALKNKVEGHKGFEPSTTDLESAALPD